MNNSSIRKIVIVVFLLSLLSLEGCEAFRKKFIRERKKKTEVEEEVILEPQQYPDASYNNFVLYKNSYTFWKAAHSELIISLEEKQSYKRQLFFFDEVVKNLYDMRNLLVEEKQKQLDYFIQEINVLKEKLVNANLKVAISPQIESKLKAIESDIRINFSYTTIQDWIKN